MVVLQMSANVPYNDRLLSGIQHSCQVSHDMYQPVDLNSDDAQQQQQQKAQSIQIKIKEDNSSWSQFKLV